MTPTEKALQAAKKTEVVTIESLIQKSAQELGKALPVHMRPERIVRIALTTLRMNPKLNQCDPRSFLGALFQSAQLGLEPNIEGQAYIIPYNSKSGLVAQFQLGYKGLVELFWRHQSAVSLQMEAIHENDEYDFDLGNNTIMHKPFLGDRGEAIAYYAVAHLQNGGRAVKVMSRIEIENFAKRFSKCYDRKTEEFYPNTPWRDHFDAMAKKTVLIQLMKLLPKSIEIQKALAMDETVKTKIAPDMFEVPKVDEPEVQGGETHAEVTDQTQKALATSGLSEEEKKEIEAAEKIMDERRKK